MKPLLIRILCTIFLGTFSLTQAFSQANYKSGYLVTAQGDSLRGELDDQEWERTPRKINFRQAGAVKTYEVGEISRFGVDGGDRYVKMTVSRSTRPVEMNRLLDDFQDTTITEPVLLRVVADGAWKLYSCYIEKPLFYIQVGDEQPEELVYSVRQDAVSQSFHTFHTYRDQLKAKQMEEGGNTEMSRTLARLRYKEEDLAAYFLSHNEPGSDKKPESRRKISAKFYAGVGVSTNPLKIEGDYTQYVRSNRLEVKTNPSPLLQLGWDFSTTRNRQRFVFRVSIAANPVKGTHYSEHPKTNTITAKKVDYTLKYVNVEPGVAIIYNFLVYNRQRYYIGMGVASSRAFFSSNKAIVEEPDWNRTKVYENFVAIKSPWASFNARAGTVISDRFDVELKYLFNGSMSPLMYYDVKYRPLALAVNYRL